jgi:putative ubiquitin-RnfH superfamily antitoxin RatB of RatAB toxin-antitoxin module
MGEAAPGIHVQLCFAKPEAQVLRHLVVPAGTTIAEAVQQSGALRDIPEIDLDSCKVGVYGKVKSLDTIVRDHDRIEIYRPLLADPKETRRRRAEKRESKGSGKP